MEFPSRPEISTPPEILKPSIRYLIVFGKGEEVINNQSTGEILTLPTEGTALAGAAAGFIYKENPREENNSILIINCGGITQLNTNISEADLLERAELEITEIPQSLRRNERQSKNTLENSEYAALILNSLNAQEDEVATLTDEDHKPSVARNLRKYNIVVKQALTFEDILENKPGFKDRVKAYREKRKKLKTRTETKIVNILDSSNRGLSILRKLSERRGGKRRSATILEKASNQ